MKLIKKEIIKDQNKLECLINKINIWIKETDDLLLKSKAKRKELTKSEFKKKNKLKNL
jgi:hypothetical protein